MASQLKKFEAHAAHLLDAFILLRERYAMLHPMLFDEEVVTTYGHGGRARGFNTLLNSLFLSCSQDIGKLCVDNYKSTPSINKFLDALADDAYREVLRERYAAWKLPEIVDQSDPELVVALQQMEAGEQAERRERFNALYGEACELWTRLSNSDALAAFRNIRDKVSAHTEIKYVADKYLPVNVGELGLTWGDLETTIDTMQRLVELIGALVRNAGFAWDLLDKHLAEASTAFWSTTEVGGR